MREATRDEILRRIRLDRYPYLDQDWDFMSYENRHRRLVELGVYLYSQEAVDAIDPAIMKCLHERTAASLSAIRREDIDLWRQLKDEPAYFTAVKRILCATSL